MVALFEARENAIEGAKLEALRLQDEASAEGEEFEVEMRRIRLQAGEERDRLRAEGKRLERTVLDRVREETDRQLAEADAKLSSEAIAPSRGHRSVGTRCWPSRSHRRC